MPFAVTRAGDCAFACAPTPESSKRGGGELGEHQARTEAASADSTVSCTERCWSRPEIVRARWVSSPGEASRNDWRFSSLVRASIRTPRAVESTKSTSPRSTTRRSGCSAQTSRSAARTSRCVVEIELPDEPHDHRAVQALDSPNRMLVESVLVAHARSGGKHSHTDRSTSDRAKASLGARLGSSCRRCSAITALEVALVRDHARLEPALEEMAAAVVAAVEAHRVEAVQPLHAPRELGLRRLDQQVEVVVEQVPDVDLPAEPRLDLERAACTKPRDRGRRARSPLLDAAADDVVPGRAGQLRPRNPGHPSEASASQPRAKPS